MVIEEIAPSKKHICFFSSKRENVLEEITRVKITKSNY